MNETQAVIGIIDDEKNIRRALKMVLNSEGYKTWEAANGEEALAQAEEHKADGVLLDLLLPDIHGLQLLEQLREKLPWLPVIIVSGHGTLTDAVEAVKRGAYDFIEKPVDKDRLLMTLRNALEVHGLRREVAQLKGGGDIVGESEQIGEVHAWIDRVAPTESRVLLLGESGTGKELVARAIHQKSKRADKAFIKVNCAAIPKELVESVLFGHVKGAFTGALKDKIGTFKQADNGTLFLDEIADMSLEAQAKVLRVLQEGEFEPVGGTKTEKVDVRVIAATHNDLQEQVKKKEFREDLFYRLAVLVLEIPPLRERKGDVAVLSRHFFREFHQNGLPDRSLSPHALAAMESYSWPGNIRQLRNVVERLAILSPAAEVRLEDLPHEVSQKATDLPASDGGGGMSLPPLGTPLADVRMNAERMYLEAVLNHTEGNVSEAARLVGMERTHLHKKISSLGIKKK
ncbi:sigma-54 dependent transcriptional regulator [bacterium]|nr:sigma-54 dependent transcriptional regulator [bacterium]